MWYDSSRLSTARHAFPLQFSTALEWAGLFISHYSCATSTAMTPEKRFHSVSLQALAGSAPLLSEECLYFLNRRRNSHVLVVKKGAFVQNMFYPSLAVLI